MAKEINKNVFLNDFESHIIDGKIGDYFLTKVKRRKSAYCNHCKKNIDCGEYVYKIESMNKWYDMLNFIGLTHIDCTEQFIENNKKENK
jgi:hypothetical protein